MTPIIKGPSRPRIAIWNSPRAGGPLRWSRDLQAQINASGAFQASLVTNPAALLAGHIWPQADLIHAAVPATYRLWRRPFVLTVKGNYQIEKNIWKALYPRAISMADVVTVPSRYLVECIPELAQAVVIPNAVDLKQFTVSPAPQSDKLQILIVTNFWFPEKARGVEQLLGLIQRALPRDVADRCEVTVVGDGAFLEKVKRGAAGYSFKTIFPGWSDPRKFFPQTHIFLYYSYHDNMPNAVLEAMAAGLPILTNAVGAIPEMLVHGRDGLIANNDEEYIQLFLDLIGNRTRQQAIGQAARQRIERDFSWEQVIEKYLQIYQRLLQ